MSVKNPMSLMATILVPMMAGLLISVVPTTITAASETDQFTGRSQSISDSLEILNAKVNETIVGIVASWESGEDRMAFVDSIHRELGGPSIVDKLERWAINSSEIQEHDTTRRTSIYGGLPIWSIRLIFLFEFGQTIQLNQQLLGSDKLSHFFSQGRKFYRRFVRDGDEVVAIKRAVFAERGIFGSLTTGSFSNADLVANYEGYRFFRSLFENDIVPGKPSILSWTDNGWAIQREFDWSDHVNEYWDEALNINYYGHFLRAHIRKKLIQFCPHYYANPSQYTIRSEEKLASRYSALSLRDTTAFRLSALCSPATDGSDAGDL